MVFNTVNEIDKLKIDDSLAISSCNKYYVTNNFLDISTMYVKCSRFFN